nr:crossover junction endonuclease eme1b [Quercus suber]
MSQPILLSDEEDDHHHFHQNALSTPLHFASKKQRLSDPNPPDIVLIDDPTPQKPGPTSTPTFVPETPLSAPNSDLVIVKCTTANSSDPQPRVSDPDHNKFSGITGLICLESDNDSESGSGRENCEVDETIGADFRVSMESEWSSKFMDSTSSLGNNSLTRMSSLEDDDDCQVHDYPEKENVSMEQINKVIQKRTKTDAEENNMTDKARGRKKMEKEERIRLMEEKKLKKEQEKLQKAAQKAEAAELRKLQKEKQKWEKGKLALKSIVAEIDAKVVELGSIGGHLLTRFAEKGLAYRITSNPIERSIVWTMNVPEHISQVVAFPLL